jgi:formamidopyrimidine-DNA glycosylase
MATLSDHELSGLYAAIKSTLQEMADKGGRDTEKDLYGNPGPYLTVMGKKNPGMICPICGNMIKRMAYLGGNIYVCEECQKA